MIETRQLLCSSYVQLKSSTVEPLNKGHLGTQAAVPYSEVVPYWEVRDKTVILCTFTASMMYKEVLASALVPEKLSAIRRCPLFGVSAIGRFLKYVYMGSAVGT